MKLALKLGIETYQILTNDDEVCIPSLSSILLAVLIRFIKRRFQLKPAKFFVKATQRAGL
jgi:hypothetical protein